MEVSNEIAQLQRERHQVIAISDQIASDLRALRTAQELAKKPREIEAINLQHRRALQSFNRAQQRLRELNASIKWHNMKTQHDIQQQAKRERAERRKAASKEARHA